MPVMMRLLFLSGLIAAAGAGGIGCSKIDLRPPVLPHAYDSNADLGTLTVTPISDRRTSVPILDRGAIRRNGFLEGRDFLRLTAGGGNGGQEWRREAQVLKAPLVETLENSLAAEAESSRRFRGGTGKGDHVMTMQLEGQADDPLTGTVLPMAAGFIPVPGVAMGVTMAASHLGSTVEAQGRLAGTVILKRGDAEIFSKRIEVELSDKGLALDENSVTRKLMETAVSRLAHLAIAESCRYLDGGKVEQPATREPTARKPLILGPQNGGAAGINGDARAAPGRLGGEPPAPVDPGEDGRSRPVPTRRPNLSGEAVRP
jgi:hypothetical protein